MTVTSGIVSSRVGGRIFRTEFAPADLGEARFGVALFHGLGDHIGVYHEVAAMMVAAGGQVVGIDWPGNGSSPGARGHLGGVRAAVGMIGETVALLRSRLPAGAPTMLAAHSTGAFLVVQYLLEHSEGIDAVWLNGALVEPAAGQPWTKQVAALALGTVVPRFTVSTGIDRSMCRRATEEMPGFHGRVSLGFGAALLRARRGLFARVGTLPPGIDLLMTHGGDDVVCLPGTARKLFEAMPMKRKRFELLPGLLHETFRDEGKEALFATVRPWVARVAGGGR